MGSDFERIFCGFSSLHCLPVAMVDKPSVETGTVIPPDTSRECAKQAGYRNVDILPVESKTFYVDRLAE